MLELKQIEPFYPQPLRPFKRNLLREYLQYKILEIIFSFRPARRLIFMGGTALHIAYGLPRFSEDLDFDNLGLVKADFIKLAADIQKKLKLQGYNAEVKNAFMGAWHSYIKIPDILYESKLSGHKEEKMLIQLDVEPQKFSYLPDKIILNKFDVFARINVAPPSLLLAQKIYAIFMRRRPLGRDFYDAIYLFGRTPPNFSYLGQKLRINNFADLKKILLKRCKSLNFKALAKDVEQFLFVPADAERIVFFPEFIEDLTEYPKA